MDIVVGVADVINASTIVGLAVNDCRKLGVRATREVLLASAAHHLHTRGRRGLVYYYACVLAAVRNMTEHGYLSTIVDGHEDGAMLVLTPMGIARTEEIAEEIEHVPVVILTGCGESDCPGCNPQPPARSPSADPKSLPN